MQSVYSFSLVYMHVNFLCLKKEGSLWLCCACGGAFATSTVVAAAATTAAALCGRAKFLHCSPHWGAPGGHGDYDAGTQCSKRTVYAIAKAATGAAHMARTVGWQRSLEVGCKSRQATSKRWKPFAGLEKQTVWLRRYMRTSKAATGEAHRARARQGWCFFRPATMATRT